MALQEEVEQRTVTLIVNTAKLTERELQKAINIYADVTKELKKNEFSGLDRYFKDEDRATSDLPR